MTQIEISKCCKAIAMEGYKKNSNGEDSEIEIWICSKCRKECQVEKVCENCLGTGTVDKMGYVYPGEAHMAPIDSGRCPECCADDYDDFGNDE